jgi:hypothetical protein
VELQAALSRAPLTVSKSVPQSHASRDINSSSTNHYTHSTLIRPTVLSNSPLHWAATRGNLRITWMLLQVSSNCQQ